MSMITSELRLLPDPSLYGGPDIRAEAGRMASDRFGRMSLVEMPPVVNLCALRIRMGSDFTSYRIAAGVLERVRGLSVSCSPYSCPKMMDGVFIVESDNPSVPLFGNTVSLAGYWLDGRLFMLGSGSSGGMFVANVLPKWDGSDSETIRTDRIIMGSEAEVDAFSKNAFSFMVRLSLLMESERAPVEVSSVRPSSKRTRNSYLPSDRVTVRYVSLSRRYASSRTQSGEVGHMDETGRVAVRSEVSGFIRLQHYGTGNSLSKYIYVDSFESTRWTSSGERVVKVVE